MIDQLPIFYSAEALSPGKVFSLDEQTGKHIGLVLRKKEGDKVLLTDGKGLSALAGIISVSKKKVEVRLGDVQEHAPAPGRKTAIAIAPVKHAGRFEWFLEKAAELGVRDIYLIQTQRTEKTHLRLDRLQQILQSAMLQSRQYHLPVLHALASFSAVLQKQDYQHTFFAHCMEGSKTPLDTALHGTTDALIFIGPEGDFTPNELEEATTLGAISIALGETRLRTETAALTAAVLCRQLA